jgi:ABC-type transport system involved in multi-copper enzyme maturation permease subunit
MTWLAVRLVRAQTLVAAGLLAVVCAVLVATRGDVARLAPTGDLSPGTDHLRLLGTALIGLPALIGAFWGAPLVARELETGTHRLVWTQSVTRTRWLATKLGIVGAVAVLVTAVFSAVMTWWSLPLDRLGNRIGTANFGQRGIAPVAYTLFALALGLLLSTLIARTLPAMAATLVAFVGVRFAVQLFVRPHLLAAVTTTRPTSLFGLPDGPTGADGAWVLSSRTVDASGHVIPDGTIDRTLADACHLTRDSDAGEFVRCAERLGIHDVVRIHPADHFWVLQAWEAAIFLALAALLTGACFWWLRRRLH